MAKRRRKTVKPIFEVYSFTRKETVELKEGETVEFLSTPVKDIDLGKMPGIEFKCIAWALEEKIKKFYQDPENCRRFKAWKKKRRAEERA